MLPTRRTVKSRRVHPKKPSLQPLRSQTRSHRPAKTRTSEQAAFQYRQVFRRGHRLTSEEMLPKARPWKMAPKRATVWQVKHGRRSRRLLPPGHRHSRHQQPRRVSDGPSRAALLLRKQNMPRTAEAIFRASDAGMTSRAPSFTLLARADGRVRSTI